MILGNGAEKKYKKIQKKLGVANILRCRSAKFFCIFSYIFLILIKFVIF